jgi:protein involved in polysaccharide export with SLBB domain
MRTRTIGGRAIWAIGLVALGLSGCALSPSNRLTLFPEGHPLTDQAKELRAASPEPWPLPKELDKRVLPAYVVEPGDVLLVQPADLESPLRLPADQPVLPDGTVHLGRYGQFLVAGRTVPEIETLARLQIQTYLAAHPELTREPATAGGPPPLPRPQDVPPIIVRVTTRVSKVYYVLGEVNAPGSFTLNGRETVLDGILAAGGLTDRASRRNIILVRPTHPDSCRVVLPVCYYQIVQLGDTSTNYQLAPGDRIYCPSRSLWEELFHGREECPPCNRPQTACSAPAACAGHAVGQEPAAPFMLPAPQFNSAEPARPASPESLPGPQPVGQAVFRRAVPVARQSAPAPSWWQRVVAHFED